MSPVARALEERFETVCRAEIARMTRKTRGLTPDERLALEDLSCQVVGAIAAHASTAIDRTGGDDLAQVLAKLFELEEVP
jgi:hypothetical protein